MRFTVRLYQQFVRSVILPALVLVAQPAALAEVDTGPMRAAEGLWEYTDLITRDGQSLPLTGVFLIKKDMFLQQSIFNGDPFALQGSMAHAGPYWAGGAGLMLRSDQTLSMDPSESNPLTSAGAMEHDLKVTRSGEDLTLQFGAGTSTIQTFKYLGDARDAVLYQLENGTLALADGYFILVVGDDNAAVTGYGNFERSGGDMTLSIIRWAESNGERVDNLQSGTLSAALTDDALTLADGRRFTITTIID